MQAVSFREGSNPAGDWNAGWGAESQGIVYFLGKKSIIKTYHSFPPSRVMSQSYDMLGYPLRQQKKHFWIRAPTIHAVNKITKIHPLGVLKKGKLLNHLFTITHPSEEKKKSSMWHVGNTQNPPKKLKMAGNSHEPGTKTLAFHYTGCLTGIRIMVYYNSHITG